MKKQIWHGLRGNRPGGVRSAAARRDLRFSPLFALTGENHIYTIDDDVTLPRVVLEVSAYAGLLEIERNADGEGTVTITGYDSANLSGDANAAVAAGIALIEEKGLTVTRIGLGAFRHMSDLTSFTVPETVLSIGYPETERDDEGDYTFSDFDDGAFTGTGLTEIVIPAAVTSIVSHAFYGANLTRVVFAEGSELDKIGEMAFAHCDGLTEITIPASVTEIGESAFLDSGLTSAAFEAPSSLELIDMFAFENVPMTAIDLPGSLRQIGEGAFFASGLTGIALPDSVETVGPSAFWGGLTWIAISPDSRLASIGDDAFMYDEALFAKSPKENVFLPESVAVITGDPFDSFYDPPGSVLEERTPINAYFDSFAAWWARQNGHPFIVAPSEGEMRANPPDRLYKYIPYEFIAKTKVPDNEGLRFWLDRELPAGLKLYDGVTPPGADAPAGILPGTIYGSPLDYTAFEGGVDFIMRAQNIAGGFTASAAFTITLAPTPDNAYLEAYVNKYPFAPDPLHGGDSHIGVYDPVTGQYEITGFYGAAGSQIMYIDAPFPLFDSLWIDGRKQTVSVQYNAENGSTRVTILAQTIQDLSNGEHTAAAAFRRADEQSQNLDVVAQNFMVNLAERPMDPGSDDGNTDPADPGDSTGPANPTNPANPTDPANPADPTEPTNPDNPTNPTDPTNPTNPTNPTIPTDPTNPTNPTNRLIQQIQITPQIRITQQARPTRQARIIRQARPIPITPQIRIIRQARPIQRIQITP
ncbi:MAG: leucine-rich repeat domain-containing protein [Gracilibacteraceae bacterium]|nr:leucine-rich repeat domain-containing protein [Gracilibacteraceae bacterium]